MEWLFKWGSLAVAAALTVGLLVLGWMLQGTVERAGQAVTLGEAESLGFAVHERLREAGLPPPPETFDRILKAFAERGLTTVAVVDPEGGVVDAAGPTPKSFPTPGLSFHEGRARLLRPLPPHGPPPGGPGGPPPGAGHPPPEGHPPLLFLEFRPKVEPVLRRETHLILGAMVILCLVVLALGGLVHRAQAQTTDLREALARDRRLAALGEMSAVLAHELRNPLASLKGHAELLAEALPEGRPQAKAERVLGEARRLERLLDDLLDYVRTGTLERAPTDPVALLRRAAEGVGEVLIEAPEGLAEWPLDPRLEQALRNLLTNSALRERCIQRGLGQPAKFTWAGAAQKLLTVYEQVGG